MRMTGLWSILAFFFWCLLPAATWAELSGSLVVAGNGPELPTLETLARAFEKANPRVYVDLLWDDNSKPLELVKTGKTIIVVTHRLPEVMRFCDEVTVLRGGKLIGSKPVYFIYNFKRGGYYPFIPAPGEQARDSERELRLKAQVGAELPFEELHYPALERSVGPWPKGTGKAG